METYLAYTFSLDDKDCLSVTGHTNHVHLMISGAGSREINIGFRPIHLSELREVIRYLEALETKQRWEEKQARWEDEQAEAKESGVPV